MGNTPFARLLRLSAQGMASRLCLPSVLVPVLLAGCAAGPPGAYPIYKSEPLEPFATVPEGNDRLVAERKAYQDRADQAQRGLYQQSDWTLAGVVVGVTGGLIGNVATTATGAGIAAGASQLGARYHLEAQRGLFDAAAKKAGCVVTVTYALRSGAPSELSDKLDKLPMLVRSMNFASMEIQSQLRQNLNALTPAPIDAAAVLAAYNSYYRMQSTPSQTSDKNVMVNGIQYPKIEQLAKEVKLAILDIDSCVKTGAPVTPSSPAIALSEANTAQPLTPADPVFGWLLNAAAK
ncbi:hypothetical protein LMG26858_03234 [Achromobacter anxifer]|uniref:Uncharacterized protein n=1 Tax=Achromobacter anxifer TaxID=1287737 RepID=A0A6S7D6X3_9BURK|nr:hypothetical protein [Achromobacter anxifer]CAB3881142.1 hypothetical protein LMG26858_03234 [Achromobacter anxifer]CAB5512433.1 hypothetical protein LMG26857_01723 [Achromobacter anxifer]